MQTFAGTVTLKWNKKINLPFDYVENLSQSGDKVIYFFWETTLETIEELLETLSEELWPVKHYDISISNKMKVEVKNEIFDDWVYELASFEWEEVNFNEIKERFEDASEVIAIRESGFSPIFWNRIVKVDFLY